MKKLLILEILVGILTLVFTIITMYPFFFGRQTGGVIFIFGIIISGLTLLMVGAFRLASVVSYETLNLAKKINIFTSVLLMATAVIILYFQIVVTGANWLHFLLGIGLLSYSVGRFVIGAFTREYNLGLRAFTLAVSIAIGVLSIIIILVPFVLISSVPHTQVYMNYIYFARISLVLIGVDYLVSGILGRFFSLQKRRLQRQKVRVFPNS